MDETENYLEASDKYYVQTWEEAKALPIWIFGLIVAVIGLLAFFIVIAIFTLTICDWFYVIFKKYCRRQKYKYHVSNESLELDKED